MQDRRQMVCKEIPKFQSEPDHVDIAPEDNDVRLYAMMACVGAEAMKLIDENIQEIQAVLQSRAHDSSDPQDFINTANSVFLPYIKSAYDSKSDQFKEKIKLLLEGKPYPNGLDLLVQGVVTSSRVMKVFAAQLAKLMPNAKPDDFAQAFKRSYPGMYRLAALKSDVYIDAFQRHFKDPNADDHSCYFELEYVKEGLPRLKFDEDLFRYETRLSQPALAAQLDVSDAVQKGCPFSFAHSTESGKYNPIKQFIDLVSEYIGTAYEQANPNTQSQVQLRLDI